MVQPRPKTPRPRAALRVVRGPTATPVIDLADAVRMYATLQEQARQLGTIMEDLRGRILRALENADVEHLDVDGLRVVRQIRHFAPQLNVEEASHLLEREGRLREAQRLVLDADRAREVLDQLYVQGRISRAELPFSEARTVEALLVRENPEHREEE